MTQPKSSVRLLAACSIAVAVVLCLVFLMPAVVLHITHKPAVVMVPAAPIDSTRYNLTARANNTPFMRPGTRLQRTIYNDRRLPPAIELLVMAPPDCNTALYAAVVAAEKLLADDHDVQVVYEPSNTVRVYKFTHDRRLIEYKGTASVSELCEFASGAQYSK